MTIATAELADTTTLYATEPTADGKPHREWLSTKFETLDKDAPEGKREVAGLFIPYGVEIERHSWQFGTAKLRIEPGSMTVLDNAKTFYGHDWQTNGIPIGQVSSSEDTPEGVRGVNTLAKSAKASDVYELCLDGTLNRFSVGFTILAYSVEDADTAEPVLVVTEGEIFECSIVPFPAYDSAAVESVLHTPRKEIEMPPTATDPAPDTAEVFSKAEGEALSAAIDKLGAQIATLGSVTPAEAGEPIPFGSYGEFVKALAAGDDDAKNLALAYEGGTIGDIGDAVKDSWLGDITRWVDQGRKVLNLFDRGALPAEGMGVEYAYLDADTTAVTEQLLEGDLLAFGKVTFATDRAPLKTYGGYGEVSKQEVERSPFHIVETFFKALGLRYNQVTEAALRAAVIDAPNAQVLGSAATFDTADGWIDFTVDAAMHFDDKGLAPEFILAGADVFKDLAKLRDGAAADAPRLLDRTSGKIDLVGLKGDLFSIPVIPINTGATLGVVRMCNGFAAKTFESGGAPLRLGPDEDITHLTQALSVYGFLAIALQDQSLIVKPGV